MAKQIKSINLGMSPTLSGVKFVMKDPDVEITLSLEAVEILVTRIMDCVEIVCDIQDEFKAARDKMKLTQELDSDDYQEKH